ncbi:PREDICTED: alpha-2-macroglobulin-like [Elephantulus edwardii]|uniref:alpha-2-macroglobulin-like n=1 Tax=Elephantulus edwardii TaxID=28737 RepID=UPI0003F0BA73|nr:PREDICTED: alpha-2-macroglobulin-like [Elephantulus edwardii]
MWDTIKTSSMSIIGIPGQEEAAKGTEKVVEELSDKNFPAMMKNQQFMVLVPAAIYTNESEKVCVLLSYLNEPVTVNITLELGMQNWNLLWKQIPELPSFIAFITAHVTGSTQVFTKKKQIYIKKPKSLVFIQTDKPIYKPGQSVRFRIVAVNVNFYPVDETFPVVYIENPKKNRIFQWQNFTLQKGLGQLSFLLSTEPILGSYNIILQKESNETIKHSFEVEEYVLPKFEVQVKIPKRIGFTEKEFPVSVCGLYTYGKPVSGLVTMKICRKYIQQYQSSCSDPSLPGICHEFSQEADNAGCFTKVIKTEGFQMKRAGYDMSLKVEGTIKEEGTELELTGSEVCHITNQLSEMRFIKADSHYRRGLPFFGQVLLVDEKAQPIPKQDLVALVLEGGQVHHFTTDEHGLAKISIDTTTLTSSSITVNVRYKQTQYCLDYWWLQEEHEQALHSANHIYSPSNSYVHFESLFGALTCGQMQEIKVHYILNEEILKGQNELTFYFLIKARGSILQSGIYVLSLEQGSMKGVFSFSFRVEPNMAPTAQLLVFAILPDGEVVADMETLQIEKCFANKVNLTFSSAQSMPASDNHLKITATPLSLCALRAVDQSMLLMKPEAELSPESVYKLLPVKELPRIANEVIGQCIRPEDLAKNGIVHTQMQILEEDDVFSIFKSAGLHIFTNSKIHKPNICRPHLPVVDNYDSYPMGIAQDQLQSPGVGGIVQPIIPHRPVEIVQEIIRKYFPETWIWELVVLDSSGESEMAVKVPDTITEWKASAFCLSKTTGLGLYPIISLQAFQPFFLELTLPYSVVKGEAFTLKVTVFNYLSYCIQVHVTLEDSSAFLAVQEENADSYCICENGRKTVSWAVTPKFLGKVNFTASAEAVHSQELCNKEESKIPPFGKKDTVIKSLLVEPEGIEKEETFNTLLCASGSEVPEKLSLKVPSNVVEGSTRATYTVVGDILASAMQNLQNLVQMPYGCGEQNMILFVPNIYVLTYLKVTQQLTEEIKSKAISYLNSGYQRQLNYKHNDGSYSAFGDHGGGTQGNTWLTAFVLKSFAQAQSFIFVETSHITHAFTWLSKRQKENGCFQRSGSLLNNALKSGVNDEVTLSAYITIALLEIPLPVNHTVVRNALLCLERAWRSISETKGSFVYTKALLAYTFALAGKQTMRSELLESLDKEAVKEENSIHWQHPGKQQEANQLYYQPRATSAEVEITSYVLLAYLTVKPAPSSEDLSKASRIVQWITKQQNPHGGFSSTQDTVVALQALAKYEAQIFTKREKTTTVTVKSSGAFTKEFQVDNANRLLLQEVQLPEIPGEYSTTVSGSGCVYLQTSLRYNILPKKDRKSPFSLMVDTLPKSCNDARAHKRFQILINISYTGERPSSNMAIVDVKMVSGFIPMKLSVKKLQERPQIPRTEVSTNHVLIYFEELTNQTLSFSFLVEQDVEVENLKPATVKAYDYYETDEFIIEEYSAPCSAESQKGNA